MDAFDFKDLRDDEALWQLLGRARSVEASPYFSRKVLREIEVVPEPSVGGWRWFLRVLAPAAICASVAILAVVEIGGGHAVQPVANADIEFETIQNLDLLVSSYESSLWLDTSSSSH